MFLVTKCVKPLRHLATSSTKSFKRSVLIGRAGNMSGYVAQVRLSVYVVWRTLS
jgi:hypothetical protein